MLELEPVKRQLQPGIVLPSLVTQPVTATPMPGTSWGGKRDYSGLLEYWHMVRRHQNAVIALAIAGAIFGFCRTLSDPRIYQAHATIEIQTVNDNFLDLKGLNPTGDAGYSADTEIQTQVRILESNSLRRRVTERMEKTPPTEPLPPTDRLSAWRKALGIAPPSNTELWQEAIGSAAGGIQVHASGVTRIVDLSCDSTSPKMAADYLNALTEEYKLQNLETRWNNTQYTGEWLQNQLQDLRKKLEKAQDDLQNYVRSENLVVTSDKNNVDESKLSDLERELSVATADRVAKQSVWETASASPADSLPAILDDANLQATQQSLQDLRRSLAQLRVTYTDKHPEVRKVEAQIAALARVFGLFPRIDLIYRDAGDGRDLIVFKHPLHPSQVQPPHRGFIEIDQLRYARHRRDLAKTP